MKAYGLNEIREMFLKFFEGKQHLRMASFPLVPQNDKSLLLINSGMAPLKPYFTGQEIPPNRRVTTCQKCIRTGDIENVGKTARHGTFFEMLGNFSFGDYFKEEIIPWSWEFITEVMEIPADRLYISVYLDDDEAFDIWNKKVGIPKEKIFRMGKEDNFWEVGLGPCGPCSEIYFDKGEKYGCGSPDCTVGCDCDRYMEFWNLVFTQFSKEEDGSYSKLDHPNIDTGMGLERIAAMMQNVDTIFDVDTIKSIRDSVCQLAKVEYGQDPKKDVSIRVITDHIRSVTFMTADGVLPSNEGRGYVLRRLLRRAARHGKLLGVNAVFLIELCEKVIEVSKDAYPELLEKKDYIFKVLSVEENRFYETLDQGMEILQKHIKTLKENNSNSLLGNEAFKLYDTFGFPLELMKEILEEEFLSIDEEDFLKEMENQKERARAAREESNYMGAAETVYNKLELGAATEFLGYDQTTVTATITALIANNEISGRAKKGDSVSIILDKTSFYAESGGQKGDRGIVKTGSGTAEITDCIKIVGNKFAHVGIVTEGEIKKGEPADVQIDLKRRLSTARNHTATHLLQKALRETIGTHVLQSGSSVSHDRLRFDFTHFSPLTNEEIRQVEDIVNDKIMEAIPVAVSVKSIEEARKMGAMALFGEKYGAEVRVVDIDSYSTEFCGGTHLTNTAQVGTFKIISETGVAAGVRRIEALTGAGALSYFREQEEKLNMVAHILKATPENVLNRIKNFMSESKDLHSQLEKLNAKLSLNIVDDILQKAGKIQDTIVVAAEIDKMDMNGLRTMGDKIKDKIGSGVLILASKDAEKVNLLVMVTDDVVKKGAHAGNIVKETSQIIGGSGGGKPNMAQAGGKFADKINDAISKAKEILKTQLS